MKNKNIYFILVLVVLAIFASYPMHTALKSVTFNDFMFNYHLHQFIKESLSYGQFQHWIPNIFAGMPYFANAQSMVFSLSGILTIFLPTVTALHLSFILDLIIAGIGMFFLMLYFKIEKKFAFISAILFMFNGWTMHHFLGGGLERLNTYVWLPLIFLFCFKAFQEKQWFKYSLITAIMLALAFFGGGLDTFLWILLFIFILFACSPLHSNKSFKKLVLIGFVISILLFCLISIKFLPLLEFNQFTNKATGFTFEQSFEQKLNIKDAFLMPFGKTLKTVSYPIRIGFLGFVLVLLSLTKIKDKKIMFFALIALINILICMFINFYYPLYTFIPGFSAQHDVTRSLFITVFSFSVLAGFGASILFSRLKPVQKEVKTKNMLWIVFVVIILLELVVFGLKDNPPNNYFDEHLEHNYLLQNLSKEEDIFRIHNIGTTAIGGATGAYAVPLHLQILYGFNNVWIKEYFNEYLVITHSEPAKFYGMLNTKYIYHNKSINLTDFEFVKKFEDSFCFGDNTDSGVAGPYLYKNKKYLPRAYMADKAVLVVGDKKTVRAATYIILLNENFNPADTVVIIGKKDEINNYKAEFLERFDIVIDPNTSTQEDVDLLWEEIKSNKSYEDVEEVEITYYSPNKIIFNVSETSKFLVLSEKFFMFSGWKAELNGKEIDIFRANGINSAVWIEETGELVFEYKPKSFKIGSMISYLTLMGIIIYFLLKKLRGYEK